MRPLLLLLAGLAFGCRSLPASQTGPAADQLAHEMLRAVNTAAWQRTGAVRWDFAARHHHLWDRHRSFAEVTWGDSRAVIDLQHRVGRAFQGGVELHGEVAVATLDGAHAKWTNDSFWLNPIAKAFDPGAERSRVEAKTLAGERGLIVRFASGGRTPGDTYLFWLGGDGRPLRWQLWVSIIPFNGMETSWEHWVRLPTGARIATLHRTVMFDLELSKVEGAASLSELVSGGADPFAELAACGGQPGVCTKF